MAELIQNHRSESVDDFGTIMAGFSDDWVIRIIAGELVTVGLVTRDASVASTGLRVITAHVIGGVLVSTPHSAITRRMRHARPRRCGRIELLFVTDRTG